MLVIVDYGMGNLNSIANMVKKAGGKSKISQCLEDIEQADQLILPGVGSFDSGMRNLQNHNLVSLLCERVLDAKVPVLGICLGMQLMARSSDEGDLPGLGWFSADTRRFDFGENRDCLKVPNMGWRVVRPWRSERLFAGFQELPRFYFVHSFHYVCDRREDVLATAHYGYEFCCAVQRDNIWGVQFHPEKSHRFGCRVLSNFLRLAESEQAVAA